MKNPLTTTPLSFSQPVCCGTLVCRFNWPLCPFIWTKIITPTLIVNYSIHDFYFWWFHTGPARTYRRHRPGPRAQISKGANVLAKKKTIKEEEKNNNLAKPKRLAIGEGRGCCCAPVLAIYLSIYPIHDADLRPMSLYLPPSLSSLDQSASGSSASYDSSDLL